MIGVVVLVAVVWGFVALVLDARQRNVGKPRGRWF